MVFLGYGKYWRSDRILGLTPIEQGRGPGQRTNVFIEGQSEPIVASRTEQAILEDMGASDDSFQQEALRQATRALLILYMTAAAARGGLGFSTEHAASIYGWYTFGVYAAAIPGGIIADRWLGQFRSVLWGGVIIALGHFSLAYPSLPTFYLGLTLIVMGTGLLKPNISTMVGSLYDPADVRRDAGFSIFYMGINVGAFVAPLIVGTLGQRVDWHVGFGCAGIGMTLGLIQYVVGKPRLLPALERLGQSETKPAAAASTEPWWRFTPQEWKRVIAIAVLFVFSSIFWAAFEQAGSSLNLFADRPPKNVALGYSFPSTWDQSLNP